MRTGISISRSAFPISVKRPGSSPMPARARARRSSAPPNGAVTPRSSGVTVSSPAVGLDALALARRGAHARRPAPQPRAHRRAGPPRAGRRRPGEEEPRCCGALGRDGAHSTTDRIGAGHAGARPDVTEPAPPDVEPSMWDLTKAMNDDERSWQAIAARDA